MAWHRLPVVNAYRRVYVDTGNKCVYNAYTPRWLRQEKVSAVMISMPETQKRG
jgi:hypothetical protein